MFPTLLRFVSESLWLVCFAAAAFAVVSAVIAIRNRKWGWLAFYVVAFGISVWGGFELK
jgi:hypothetical protein